MSIPPRLVAAGVAVAVAAAVAFARRPVKPPATAGSWLPSSRQPTRH